MNLSRRDFLTCAGAASLAVGSNGVHGFSSTKKLRLGFAGVGNRGESNLFALKDQQVAALCDVDAKLLATASKHFPSAKKFTDFRQMLKSLNLDAVVVSTPDHTHDVIASAAMKKGLHVYCEKPLAHNVQECVELAKLEITSKTINQFGNQHQSSPGYQATIQLIRQNQLGKVQSVHAWTNRPIWPQGMKGLKPKAPIPVHMNWDLWLGPAPQRPFHPDYHPRMWRGWWDFGGGALADMGPHLLDPVMAALKLEPLSVKATSEGGTSFSPPTSSHIQWDCRCGGKPIVVHWHDGNWRPKAADLGLPRLPANGTLIKGSDASLFFSSHGAKPFILRKGKSPKLVTTNEATLNHYQRWLARVAGNSDEFAPDLQYGARLTQFCQLGNIAIRTASELTIDPQTGLPKNANASKYLARAKRTGW